MIVSPARPEDLTSLAAVQIASWQSAYRGILSDAFLDQEVPDLLRQRWSDWPGLDWRVEVARVDDAPQGFVSVDLARSGGPYVDNFHVLPNGQGRGIGRALMVRAARHAQPQGRLWLTVIAQNAQARAVYQALGGREEPAGDELLYGQPVRTHVVHWSGDALRRLAAPG